MTQSKPDAHALQELKRYPKGDTYSEQGYYMGWNACIDHLAATNRLAIVTDTDVGSITEPVENKAINTVTDTDRAAKIKVIIKECQHDARWMDIKDTHIEAVIKWVFEYHSNALSQPALSQPTAPVAVVSEDDENQLAWLDEEMLYDMGREHDAQSALKWFKDIRDRQVIPTHLLEFVAMQTIEKALHVYAAPQPAPPADVSEDERDLDALAKPNVGWYEQYPDQTLCDHLYNSGWNDCLSEVSALTRAKSDERVPMDVLQQVARSLEFYSVKDFTPKPKETERSKKYRQDRIAQHEERLIQDKGHYASKALAALQPYLKGE